VIQDTIPKAKEVTDFRTYCIQTLNESFPNLEEKPTMFQLREAKPLSVNPKTLTKQENVGWSFAIFIFIFLIFGLLFRTKANGFITMIRSCFNVKVFEALLKDGKLINKVLIFPIFLLYVCLVGLMSEKAISFFGVDMGISPFKVLLLAMGAVVVFSLAKLILIKFLGLLFSNKKNVSLYISNQIVFFALDILLLIFPVFCSFFLNLALVEGILYLSLVMFALLSIIRASRGFFLLLKTANSFNLYLFLYLCIVEIVPLLIAAKILFANI
jgi:hypothetical protein